MCGDKMISAVVPVYKVEKYLRRCVDSLLAQDIDEEYEIILVDDGSPDGSGKICDEYQSKYPEKIQAVHKENGGLSSARNEGLRHAKGEWITFVDSDDYVSPTYLSVLDRLRKKFDADMAVITAKGVKEDQELGDAEKRFEDFVLDKKSAFYEIYFKGVFSWSAWAKLYRKSIFQNYGFPEGVYYEDIPSQYLFIEQCDKVAFGDYITEYHYIIREGSITSGSFSEKNLIIFDHCAQVREYILKTYPEWEYASVLIYENAVVHLLNRLKLTKEQYKDIFLKYRPLFRKNLWKILTNRNIDFGRKYYVLILCTTPGICKLQRDLRKKLFRNKVKI